MSLACVCLSCGAEKWGALTACRSCKVKPESFTDQARAMLASADYHDADGLQELSRRVRAGEEISFDAEALRDMAEDLERMPVAPLSFVFMVVALPSLAILLLLGFAVVCFGG